MRGSWWNERDLDSSGENPDSKSSHSTASPARDEPCAAFTTGPSSRLKIGPGSTEDPKPVDDLPFAKAPSRVHPRQLAITNPSRNRSPIVATPALRYPGASTGWIKKHAT